MNAIEKWAVTQALKNWIKQHKTSTHTLALLVAAAITAYQSNQQFHDLVQQLLGKSPKWVATVVALVVTLYAWYRNGEKLPLAPDDKPGPDPAAGNDAGTSVFG